MKIEQTFAFRAKKFIVSACNQRIMLLNKGKSKSKEPRIRDIALGLKDGVDPLTTDRSIAKYIHKNGDDIIKIIPECNCKAFKTRLEKLNWLIYEAGKILEAGI